MHPLGFEYSLAGLAIGALVGLTGVGGGSLMTPLLVLLFGLQPMHAVGTDLLFAAVTKAVGTLVHGKARTVAWRVTGWMALGSLPVAALLLLGLWRLGRPGRDFDHAIAEALGAALILTSLMVAFRPWIVAQARARLGAPRPGRSTLGTVLLGAALGVLVPLTSVGAGAIAMPVLMVLHPTMPAPRIVGADIAHAVPLTLLAGLGLLLAGVVDPGLLGWLLLGSLPGVVLGSLGATRVPQGALRSALSVALVLAGWRMLA